jgi:hypothetical protein
MTMIPYFTEDFRPAAKIIYHLSPLLSGLPSHSDSLLLRNTFQDKPYNLYNIDRYLWSVNSRASMYGSSPLLLNWGTFG